jgi:hypothetical protein
VPVEAHCRESCRYSTGRKTRGPARPPALH